MKILYVSHLHPPKNKPLKNVGGMQSVSVQMTKALNRREDIELRTLILNSSWRFIGIKTFFFLLTLLWKIPRNVKKYNPDVILFSSMVTACVLPVMKKVSVPTVTINHGQDVTLPVKPYQWYLKYVFEKLDGVISVSSATRKVSIKRGLKPEKGVALPNGFEVIENEKLPSKKEALYIVEKEFSKDLEGKKILLTVGRQVKRKGHAWFIEEVLPKVKSDVLYFVVGSGPEFKNIQNVVENSPVKNQVVMTGKLSKELLNTCYAAGDLFIMPNIPVTGDMEGFGIVLLEANRAGMPAIASDLEGIKDVIEQGVNGFRIPSEDSMAFASKIDEVLNNDLEAFSKRAQEYVTSTFDWDVVVEKYISFLKDVNE